MKTDILDGLKDDELQIVIEYAQTLLKTRDEDRKAKALSEAKALLESVGLSLKDLAAAKVSKAPAYRGGHSYQHPANKALVWQAKGKKPGWLVTLEAEGGKPVEIVAANDNTSFGRPANDAAPSRKVG